MTNAELEQLAQEIEAMKHDILTINAEPKCKAWAVASFEDASARIRSKIVKPRIKRTVWLNVYADKSGDYSQARSIADCMAGPNRIACVKVEIDCEHGEGL